MAHSCNSIFRSPPFTNRFDHFIAFEILINKLLIVTLLSNDLHTWWILKGAKSEEFPTEPYNYKDKKTVVLSYLNYVGVIPRLLIQWTEELN